MDTVKTHFLSADGYSEGYQLNTSLNSPNKDSLDKSFWRFSVRSSDVDMSTTAAATAQENSVVMCRVASTKMAKL